jgi:hypothetical protein
MIDQRTPKGSRIEAWRSPEAKVFGSSRRAAPASIARVTTSSTLGQYKPIE